MNSDFLLNATPGLARRLVKLAATGRVFVDDAIREKAKEGLLTPEDFDALPSPFSYPQKRAAVQTLTDFGLRGILLGDQESRDVLIATALINNQKPFFVVSHMPYAWRVLSKKWGLKLGKIGDENVDIILITEEEAPLDQMTDYRDRLFVLDLIGGPAFMSSHKYAVTEFEKSIILTDVTMSGQWFRDPHVLNAMSTLYPKFAYTMLTRRKLRRQGFKIGSLRDLDFMFGVCTSLLALVAPSYETSDKEEDLTDLHAVVLDITFDDNVF